MDLDFITDAESHDYCMSIATKMAKKYGISLSDAIRRINRLWVGTTFVGEHDLVYHRPETFWVDHIYNFYEDRIRDGTADTPREVLIEETRQLLERRQSSMPPDLPGDRRGANLNE